MYDVWCLLCVCEFACVFVKYCNRSIWWWWPIAKHFPCRDSLTRERPPSGDIFSLPIDRDQRRCWSVFLKRSIRDSFPTHRYKLIQVCDFVSLFYFGGLHIWSSCVLLISTKHFRFCASRFMLFTKLHFMWRSLFWRSSSQSWDSRRLDW